MRAPARVLPRALARALLPGAALVASAMICAAAAAGQTAREAAERLRYPALRFAPPVPEMKEVEGVRVMYLEDRTVPLVNLLAYFKGGYGRLPRRLYGPAMALPSLLRYGGTEALPPDSVDLRIEFWALQTMFGGGGASVYSSLNTLTQNLDPALTLWGSMLRAPAFDSAEVEGWRGRELETVRRRVDDPQGLAFSQFNRLMYGDHPVGWEMEEGDLTPEKLSSATLREVQGRIVCPEHMILGVSGDVSWSEIEPRLREMVRGWPPCTAPLPEPPLPELRTGPAVFLIPRDLEQSVLVMAQGTDVHLGEDTDYFAAQIGNSILGASGFSSRLLSRVRTQEGYAYSASSLWTMPRKERGLVGAVTRTRPENTVPALRLILETIGEMASDPPTREEVAHSVDQIVNSFVFNFDATANVVSRRMSYLAQELPGDWLERYVRGVQNVTPGSILEVFRTHVRPQEMIILVVGDPERIGMEALSEFGPVTVLDLPGER